MPYLRLAERGQHTLQLEVAWLAGCGVARQADPSGWLGAMGRCTSTGVSLVPITGEKGPQQSTYWCSPKYEGSSKQFSREYFPSHLPHFGQFHDTSLVVIPDISSFPRQVVTLQKFSNQINM